MPTIAASEAKNRLGKVFDQVLSEGPVAISRHDEPRVVILSVSEFERMRRASSSTERWVHEWSENLVARMQTPEAKKAADTFFNATPEQLGESAVNAAAKP